MAERTRPLLLLADPDPTARARLVGCLEEFEVFAAESGAEALVLFPRVQPDGVLLDNGLTDIAAADVCARLRAMPGGADIPVVLLTSSTESSSLFAPVAASDIVREPKTEAHGDLAHRLRYLVHSAMQLRHTRESAMRLARAQRLARFAWWELVPETGRFRWSDEVTSIFGIPAMDEDGGISAILRWVHPEDRFRVANAVLEPVPHRIEYRLVLPDGRVRTIHQEADAICDERKTTIQMIGAAQDVTELREAERQVRELAYFDSLTCLPNRSLLHRYLERAVADAIRAPSRLAVLAIDLDGFKRVNDTLGHGAGDALLREVGLRLMGSIRGMRSGSCTDDATLRYEEHLEADAIVARIGGDEFVVVLSDITRPEDAGVVARRMGDELAKSFNLGGTQVFISSSVGIACLPDNGTAVDELLERADTALYHAKEKGRNNFQFFTPSLFEKARRRLAVESGLRAAMNRAGIGGEPSREPCEFQILFQPKIEISTSRMVGAEALIRWRSPELGVVAPSELIPIAEETGLIVELGAWVIRTACEQALAWAEDGRGDLKVSVNVSARQFREHDFVRRVGRILAETGMCPRLLELEVTEGVVMKDAAASTKVLSALKALGVRIALDDFGTGYSSLSYLTKLPIDALKIDRSFVCGLGTEEKSATITSAIIGLSRGLMLDIVVEGVETEEQLEFVAQHGSAEIQGYLFAQPMPLDDLAMWALSKRAIRSPEESGLFPAFTVPSASAGLEP